MNTQPEQLLIIPVGTCASVMCQAPRPDEAVELDELRQLLASAIKSLTRKEASIVRRYFGLDGRHGTQTLAEIGQHFSLSVERIRQIKGKALRKLRHSSRREKLAIYVGIHSRAEFARFVTAETAAWQAADKAEWAAKSEARERAWVERQKQQAAARSQQADTWKAWIEDLIQSLGDEVGPCTAWSPDCKREVVTTLGSLVAQRSTEVRSEAALFSYFVTLVRQYPTSLHRGYATWMRDVPAQTTVTFTRGYMRNGAFMLFARGADRCTWYLLDLPDGLRWIGYEEPRACALP